MRRIIQSGIILMIVASITSCGNGRLPDNVGASENSVSMKVLPLPEVPDTALSVKSRTKYILRHFWDGLNFSKDTELTHDRDFMEQNFVNYIYITNVADDRTATCAMKHLLRDARCDSVAYDMLLDIAHKYLCNPESPVVNEDTYDRFLRAEMKAETVCPQK
jgi:hypothetical protein